MAKKRVDWPGKKTGAINMQEESRRQAQHERHHWKIVTAILLLAMFVIVGYGYHLWAITVNQVSTGKAATI